ncbi:hypothetical protein [Herbaspirillum sp. ST 5-3]|uniref:hypothetical protein n=1 Tax=Oxalobacteraceae TaxID=75682 RepID=UPI0010A535AA|nr:hypothetical protein [Herbaspirillum sp. ST 5-3]
MKRPAIDRRIHRCVMVYPSGEREVMHRHTHQLNIWIQANKTFHRAAALFVDGKCRYPGHLPGATLEDLKRELSHTHLKDPS